MRWLDDVTDGWRAGFAVMVVALCFLILWWAISSWLSVLGLVM